MIFGDFWSTSKITKQTPRHQAAADVAAAAALAAESSGPGGVTGGPVEGDTGAAAPGTVEGPTTVMRCLAVGKSQRLFLGGMVHDDDGELRGIANIRKTSIVFLSMILKLVVNWGGIASETFFGGWWCMMMMMMS